MRISEFIQQLQDVYDEEGDIKWRNSYGMGSSNKTRKRIYLNV